MDSSHHSANYRTGTDLNSSQGGGAPGVSGRDVNTTAMFNKTVKVVSGTKKQFEQPVVGNKVVAAGGYSRYAGGGQTKNLKQRPIDTTSIERPQI